MRSQCDQKPFCKYSDMHRLCILVWWDDKVKDTWWSVHYHHMTHQLLYHTYMGHHYTLVYSTMLVWTHWRLISLKGFSVWSIVGHQTIILILSHCTDEAQTHMLTHLQSHCKNTLKSPIECVTDFSFFKKMTDGNVGGNRSHFLALFGPLWSHLYHYFPLTMTTHTPNVVFSLLHLNASVRKSQHLIRHLQYATAPSSHSFPLLLWTL